MVYSTAGRRDGYWKLQLQSPEPRQHGPHDESPTVWVPTSFYHGMR